MVSERLGDSLGIKGKGERTVNDDSKSSNLSH